MKSFGLIGNRPSWWYFILGLSLVASLTAAVFYVPRLFGPPTVSDFTRWPVETKGYEIETLPVQFVASFVRGNDVYFATADGRLFHGRDDRFIPPFDELPSPVSGSGWAPRLIFASSSGTLFVSTKAGPTYRSTDQGRNWTPVLLFPGWRMDEADPGTLVIGNYPHHAQSAKNPKGATVFLSRDDGQTWISREVCARCWHVHTVRWDRQSHRLYLAYGDGKYRGEGHLELEADRLVVSGSGFGHGHTDVGFTRDYVFWGSDDGRGHVLRENRQQGKVNILINGKNHYIWWIITDGDHVYLGTMPAQVNGGDKSVVLASPDQGESWQKILESAPSRREFDRGFEAESRNASTNGWVYCSNVAKAERHALPEVESSFRIRRKNERSGAK